MRILVLAPPTNEGKSWAIRAGVLLRAIGHTTITPDTEAQTPEAALRMMGAVLVQGAACDAVFYDGNRWNWKTGSCLAGIFAKYKLRNLSPYNLMTMEEGDG